MVKIANVYYTAGEPRKVAAFYQQVFGLKTKFEDGDRWIQFDVDGVNIAIAGKTESAISPAIGLAVVTFEVEDADEVARQIEAAGGSIVEARDMGSHGRTITCRDVAGNLFQLFAR